MTEPTPAFPAEPTPPAEPRPLDSTLPLPTELLSASGGYGSAEVPEHRSYPQSSGWPPTPQVQPPAPPRPAPAPPAFAPQPIGSAPQAPPHGGPPPAAAPGHAPILVQLGEVSVSSTTIYTPAGEIPLKGSQWTLSDQWQAQHKIPAWAIVCAILLFFFLCFLSLFFLLAKETRYTGTIQITITNGPRQYVARIPVTDQRIAQHVNSQVNYVRSLASL